MELLIDQCRWMSLVSPSERRFCSTTDQHHHPVFLLLPARPWPHSPASQPPSTTSSRMRLAATCTPEEGRRSCTCPWQLLLTHPPPSISRCHVDGRKLIPSFDDRILVYLIRSVDDRFTPLHAPAISPCWSFPARPPTALSMLSHNVHFCRSLQHPSALQHGDMLIICLGNLDDHPSSTTSRLVPVEVSSYRDAVCGMKGMRDVLSSPSIVHS